MSLAERQYEMSKKRNGGKILQSEKKAEVEMKEKERKEKEAREKAKADKE